MSLWILRTRLTSSTSSGFGTELSNVLFVGKNGSEDPQVVCIGQEGGLCEIYLDLDMCNTFANQEQKEKE